MASFESRVSDIFDENPRLARNIPVVIRKLFRESESEFKRKSRSCSEDEYKSRLLKLFDILFIDFYFKEIDDRFLSWVIEQYPERFTAEELDEMRAQAGSHLDFYEIQEVMPGRGSRIKSLFTEDEGFLKDVSSSYHFVKWDIILSRCYRFHGNYLATGSVSRFNIIDKELIMERMNKAYSDFMLHYKDSEYNDFAKSRWEVFFQIEHESHEKAKNRVFYTSYGRLQLCEVRFHVHDLKSILEKIKDFEEFNQVDIKERRIGNKKRKVKRYHYDWLTLGIEEELADIRTGDVTDGVLLFTKQLDIAGKDTGIEAIGSLYLDELLARLETRSMELAGFASRHIPALFGSALAFKRINKMSMNPKTASAVNEDDTPVSQLSGPPPELKRKINRKVYLSRLDERIPALNHLTPREARQDPAMLPRLIDWLKGFENILERRRMEGDEVISINLIKKALNIDW
ncbi:hypothetical protein JW948_16520 [bacterium]|nr:hypothetical protein [bacterium]